MISQTNSVGIGMPRLDTGEKQASERNKAHLDSSTPKQRFTIKIVIRCVYSGAKAGLEAMYRLSHGVTTYPQNPAGRELETILASFTPSTGQARE